MDFKQHISQILSKSEVDSLFLALQMNPQSGIRINTQKMNQAIFDNLFPSLLPHPIVEEGYLNNENLPLGRHPFHAAGAYYIQEPSAMIVAALFDYHSDDFVLDVCAAPGGKATYAGMKIGDNGVLIANDMNFSRAKILNENVERMGLKNVLVTSNSIDALLLNYRGCFDKIILDAPCSGEGMFRKNPLAKEDWSIEKVTRLQEIQKELILKSYQLLKKGGLMIYSTCTFSIEENEEVIRFLLSQTRASLVTIPNFLHIDRGIQMPEAIRIYPSHFPGEGHFIAMIQANDETPTFIKSLPLNQSRSSFQIIQTFFKTYMNLCLDPSRLSMNQDHAHYLPNKLKGLPALTLLRSGLHLGEITNNHFEPSHALACASQINDWKNVIDFDSASNEIKAYLAGESFKVNADFSGYCLITCNGLSIGYGKVTNGMLKNHYPKGLRQK